MSTDPGQGPQQRLTPAVLRSVNRNQVSPGIAIGLAFIIGGFIGAGVAFASADGGPNRNLAHNVQDGARNGTVASVYQNEICFTLKNYMAGGRGDDFTSCAAKSEFKNLGKDYSSEGDTINAKAVDVKEDEPKVLSITAFEIKGGDSGLLLGSPVEQKPAIAKPTSTSTVPAPVLPNSGSDGK